MRIDFGCARHCYHSNKNRFYSKFATKKVCSGSNCQQQLIFQWHTNTRICVSMQQVDQSYGVHSIQRKKLIKMRKKLHPPRTCLFKSRTHVISRAQSVIRTQILLLLYFYQIENSLEYFIITCGRQ